MPESTPKPRDPQPLISRLRARGFPEESLQILAAELERASRSDTEYACSSCGRSSSGGSIEVELDGEPAYASPTQWVYCYRERKPFGLCDHCFRAGRYEGFSPEEIAYFRQRFDAPDEPNDVA